MLAEEIAVIFIATQTNSSTFLWGSPGQGKSSLVRRGFSALGYRVHTIRLNTTLPHYLGGSPLPDQTNRTYDLVPPGWVRELNEADKSVLFLDDVTCAAPMVQTAALGLLDELEVAGITLKAIPIVAGNPNELATARFDLDAATANRCFHVWITSDAQSFKAAAEKDFPAPNVPVLRPGWKDRISVHRARILEFLVNSGSKLVNAMPPQMSKATTAWPSERTWEKTWNMLAAYDGIDPNSVPGVNLPAIKRLLFLGCVGEGAYKEFVHHVITPMEADAAKALAQGRNFAFPSQGDKVFGLLSAIAAKLQSGRLTEVNWNSAWGLVEALKDAGQLDRGVTFVQDLVSIGAGHFNTPKLYKDEIVPLLNGGR